MWTLIVLGLVFLGWYIMSPQGEAGAAADAPAPPEAPAADAPAEDHATTDGSEFTSAQGSGEAPAAEAAPAEAAPAEAPSSGGGGSEFSAPS